MNVLSELRDRFRRALAPLVSETAGGFDAGLLDMVRPAQDARFGDYQANCAMPLAKQLGRPARGVAEELVQGLQVDDLCHPPEIAGPGFINLRLRDEWLVRELRQLVSDARLGIAVASQPKTILVDYSAPNVAKPMHVGHIRSTVIGDAICRMLRFAGHRVISDNHLGDWGTQFGMIIYGYKHFVDAAAYERQPVVELGRLYRLVRQLMDVQEAQSQLPVAVAKVEQLTQSSLAAREAAAVAPAGEPLKRAEKTARLAADQRRSAEAERDSWQARCEAAARDGELSARLAAHPDVETSVLRETAKLHAGDADNRRLWQTFLPSCRADIQRIYDRLHVTFDHELGESFYHERCAPVLEALQSAGMAVDSQGALCVFLDGFETPMIVRKRDGAYLYATTDLATLQYRVETWQPAAILYVVDFRQSEHFAKLFAAVRQWGYTQIDLRHISFGTVLGKDGRPYKTRSGDTVGLDGLLDEAVHKAHEVVSQNDDGKPDGPELSAEQRQHIAQVIGMAALKYADLSQNRTSDYEYSPEKMLSLQGNTATYMQYSFARVHGIFAKGNIDPQVLRQRPECLHLTSPAERSLGLALLRFAEALDDALSDYRPNQLTQYLFDLAKRFSTFFEECPVLRADTPAERDSRLMLCDLTARTIQQGLELLGIQVVQKM